MALGLFAIAIFYATAPAIPFQDYPNQELVLRLARAFARGESSEYLLPASDHAFGYSLLYALDHMASAFVTEARLLRCVTAAASLLIPISVAAVARACGRGAAFAGVLALPLAFAWPVCMGLVPFVLALPLALFAVAAILGDAHSPTPARLATAAGLLLACYLAHPLQFAEASLVTAAAFAVVRAEWRRRLGRLCLAAVPALLLALRDVAGGVFAQVPATDVTWQSSPVLFRSPTDALVHLVTRSFCITSPAALAAYALLLVTVAAGAIRAARADAVSGSEPRRMLFVACITALAISVLAHASSGAVWEIGQRMATFGCALAIAFAASGVAGHRRWALASVLGVTLALAFTSSELAARAASVAARLAAPRSAADGRYLTYRLSDCDSPVESAAWGRFDSERHLWAYAASARVVTPYVFAFAKYLPVWYRAENYAATLRAPPDWEVNAVRPHGDGTACARDDVRRLENVLHLQRRDGFAGVIVVGSPARLDELVDARRGDSPDRVAAGIAVLSRRAGPS